jgi:hypothetical protein
MSFKLFNTETILAKIFTFTEDAGNNISDSFSNFGFDSTSFMLNLGVLLFALVGLIVIIVLVIILRPILIKF